MTDITDKYETFCLDEKCDTKTKELIAQSVTSVRCKDGLFDLDKGSCVGVLLLFSFCLKLN